MKDLIFDMATAIINFIYNPFYNKGNDKDMIIYFMHIREGSHGWKLPVQTMNDHHLSSPAVEKK